MSVLAFCRGLAASLVLLASNAAAGQPAEALGDPERRQLLAPASQPAGPPAAAPTGGGEAAAAEGAAELQALEQALAADQQAAPAGALAPPPADGVLQRVLQSVNPDLSFILDVAAAAFSSDAPLMAGSHDPKQTGFHLQQLELYVSSMVDPYFRFDANLIYSQFGVEVEEAYATTLALPFNLQLRAGQFLTRFGRLNNTHPHAWDFVDQMLVLGKFFGGEGNRGLGVEGSLLLPLPWYVELVASMSEAAGASTARSFYGGEQLEVQGLADFQYTLAAKQFFALSEDWSLAWGLSAALGPNPTGRDNRSEIFGSDLYLKFRPISRASYTSVSLQAEWLLRRRQLAGGVLQDHGLYATALYRLAKRWSLAGRYELVSGVEQDYLDPLWTERRQRVSGALTFWPSEFSRLRLQYSFDRPGWRAGYSAIFLAAEFAVGAHGAHSF